MNELEAVERIRRLAAGARGKGVKLGIGDDCAIYQSPGSSEDLLLTTDMVIEDVHFRASTHPPDAVGWLALARALSDIAAMGGTPRFVLVSLALAGWTDRRWMDGFYRGLLRLARRESATLAGGDLGHAERVYCDIVVGGAVPHGTALRRDGARAGDSIWISGELGGAARGLETGRGAAWRRHLYPEPRLDLGRYLRTRLKATSAMDLSDGVSIDLHRLAKASGLAARLDRPLPAASGASIEQALHGGEDYELLFTLARGVEPPARHRGLPLTRIGTMEKGKPGAVEFFGRPLAPLGYDHLRSTKPRA
jgi:thiamine-monophosphate kinase